MLIYNKSWFIYYHSKVRCLNYFQKVTISISVSVSVNHLSKKIKISHVKTKTRLNHSITVHLYILLYETRPNSFGELSCLCFVDINSSQHLVQRIYGSSAR